MVVPSGSEPHRAEEDPWPFASSPTAPAIFRRRRLRRARHRGRPAHDPLRRRRVRRPQGAEHRGVLARSSKPPSVLPETAAPSVGAFEETFRALARRRAPTASSASTCRRTLSATMQSAQVAAKALDGLCPIEVIDSKSASMGIGNLALHAARARRRRRRRRDDRARGRRAARAPAASSPRSTRSSTCGRAGASAAPRRCSARCCRSSRSSRWSTARSRRPARSAPARRRCVHHRQDARRQRRVDLRAARRRPRHRRVPRHAAARRSPAPRSSSAHIGPVVGVHVGPARRRHRLDRARPSGSEARAADVADGTADEGRRRARRRGRDAATRGALDTLLAPALGRGARGVPARARATPRTRSTRRRKR